jgi:hypothetical protein
MVTVGRRIGVICHQPVNLVMNPLERNPMAAAFGPEPARAQSQRMAPQAAHVPLW